MVFQLYHGDSSQYSCLSWVSPVLGWALKCLAQGHSHEKTQRIQCGSNPGPLDYESNTLPRSHAGTLFPNKPWFLHVCSSSLLKTLWEKEKLLMMSNFSFSHNAFYPFGDLSAIFIKFKIVSCKLFQFGRSKICRLGKG